jgi:hypothetical protein
VQNHQGVCCNVGAGITAPRAQACLIKKSIRTDRFFLRLTCRKGELEGSNLSVFLNTPYCFSQRIRCYASARASKSTQEQPREASLTDRFERERHSLSEFCRGYRESSGLTREDSVEDVHLLCIIIVLGELERCGGQSRPWGCLVPFLPPEVVSLVGVSHSCHEGIVSDCK